MVGVHSTEARKYIEGEWTAREVKSGTKRHFWQWVKHAWLYSDLLQALKVSQEVERYVQLIELFLCVQWERGKNL